MTELIATPAFQIYIGAVLILGFKLLLLANNTALSRAKASQALNPEDKKLNPDVSVVEVDEGLTARYRRAHRNALENIPLFFITGFLLTLASPSTLAAGILFGLFTFFRVLHSFAYVKQLQPWRTMSFGLGAIVQLVLLGFLGYHVFFG